MHQKFAGRLLSSIALSILIHAFSIILVLTPFLEQVHFRSVLESKPGVLHARILIDQSLLPTREAFDNNETFAAVDQPAPVDGALTRPTLYGRNLSHTVISERRAVSKLSAEQGGSNISSNKRTAAEEMALPSAPSYFESAKLDPYPVPLHDIEPEYPNSVGMQEGLVILRILINEQGLVDNAAVVRSFPPVIFDQAAITAFEKAKFSPGKLLGIAVKSQITVEVQFTPLNREGNVSGRSY